MQKRITNTINSDVYNKLFNYITVTYDVKPSIAKQIISELPDFIEKRIKELDKSNVTIQVTPMSPADFGPIPKPIDVFY